MFGDYFKQRRKELGYTVRKFAQKNNLDAGYLSRLENGLMQPPADPQKLNTLARALELKEQTPAWQEFMDLATASRNEIPFDLRSNEMVAKVLPAFYRSVRNQEINEETIENIIKVIDASRKE